MSLFDFVPLDKELRYQWHSAVLRASMAHQIRELRLSNKWTQSELGRRAGMKAARICVLENPAAKTFPTVRTLKRLAVVFDVALIIKFESWGGFLMITAEGIKIIPYPREQELAQQESKP